MTVRFQRILHSAKTILHDANANRYKDPQLLNWANAAQREIVIHKPNSNVQNEAVVMVAGTKQSLPTGGISLIEVTRNMGTNGTTPGDVIHMIEREEMDAFHPSWHTDTANATIVHAMYDPRLPKKFYIYPQQPTSAFGYAELIYNKVPTDMTITGNIGLGDEYQDVILNGLLYQAFSIDAATSPRSGERATVHKNLMLSALGVGIQTELAIKPNQGEGKQ
ncbi:MAG: DUF6682 family protein [Pseudomonadota bacterium]